MSRELWKNLIIFEELNREHPCKFAEDKIYWYKKEIRNQYSVWAQEWKHTHLVKNDYDYMVEKTVYPYEGETLEEMEEFFEEYFRIPYYDRGYDCTGQLFTSWHSIFKINGNWIIYHAISRDV